jgi:8-oxo-dGTP diphosphatase
MATDTMTSDGSSRSTRFLTFPRRLSASRLGQKHESLDEFNAAIHHFRPTACRPYTLVVVTETVSTGRNDDSFTYPSLNRQRILLGVKNRGCGKGMYNSFGGKFIHDEETVEECACRELREETNLEVTLKEMTQAKVGIQRYTFEKDPVEMIMHVFRIHLESTKHRAKQKVIECDEIAPQWFGDINHIPFDKMFADDSLWLTTLLSSDVPLTINGSYHFRENCQETNTILHYHMDIQPKMGMEAYSLGQRLFHALHNKGARSPYFGGSSKTIWIHKSKRKLSTDPNLECVNDVTGGLGTLICS